MKRNTVKGDPGDLVAVVIVAVILGGGALVHNSGCAHHAAPQELPSEGVFTAADAAAPVDALATACELTAHAWTDKPGVECPVLLGVGAGLHAAARVLSTLDQHPTSVELPDVSVRLSACGSWAPPEGVDVPAAVELAAGSIRLALAPSQMALSRIQDSWRRCVAKQVLFGVESYLATAAPEVVDEVQAPDGVLVFDGATIDLLPCEIIPSAP